jgi:hypothetical protein
MYERAAAHRPALVRVLAVGAVLAALAACSDPDTSGPEPTEPATSSITTTEESATESTPDVALAEVRAALGALDPCGLLATGTEAASARFAEGPHTCEGQLGDVRVRVEVGVPFDQASRETAEPQVIAGLAAYDQPDRCRVVFPAGASLGIAVEADSNCKGVTEAGAIVGAALATDTDSRLRTRGPDAHSACELMTGAVADPATLLDAVGEMTQGLDHCEVATGAVLSRTAISLGYTETPFDEMARLIGGDTVSVNGQDAVIDPGEGGGTCYLHTYLWSTSAEGRGDVEAEAVISASTCKEARTVAVSVVTAAAQEPASPGSVSDLLTHAG